MLRYLKWCFKLVFKIHTQEDVSTFRRHETGITQTLAWLFILLHSNAKIAWRHPTFLLWNCGMFTENTDNKAFQKTLIRASNLKWDWKNDAADPRLFVVLVSHMNKLLVNDPPGVWPSRTLPSEVAPVAWSQTWQPCSAKTQPALKHRVPNILYGQRNHSTRPTVVSMLTLKNTVPVK